MNRKQSVRWGVWYIGGRRKRRRQKGRFLPITSVLGSLAGPALGAIVGPVIKKILVVKSDANKGDMRRDKILLRWRVTPQRVALPNGQSFVARYEWVSRKNLPRNVTIRIAWQIGLRRQKNAKHKKAAAFLETL